MPTIDPLLLVLSGGAYLVLSGAFAATCTDLSSRFPWIEDDFFFFRFLALLMLIALAPLLAHAWAFAWTCFLTSLGAPGA